MVSTVKKSQVTMPGAWARRNSIQVGPRRRGAGPRWWRRTMVRTEVAEMTRPSLAHSPLTRWYPQRGCLGPIAARVDNAGVKTSPFVVVVQAGPVSGDELAMPAHQRGWGDQ